MYSKIFMRIILLFLFFTLLNAQETPFLNHQERMMLINELSGDRSFEHIRALSRWHRNSGMDGYFKAADYIIEEAKKAGLEDVRFMEQDLGRQNYTAISAELWITSPLELKLADLGDHTLFLSDNSRNADLEDVELVYVADGSKEALEDIDVEGKIVLTYSVPSVAVKNAVWRKGALGVVSYPTSESRSKLDFPDQIAWTRIQYKVPEGKQETFSFNLSPRKGEMLREMLQSTKEKDFFKTGQKVKGGKILLKAKVKTKFTDQNRTGFVEGWIRGSQYDDQQIVITAHLQEEQGSANDDGSGCANMLEIARTLNKLIDEGKIERPLRDIRFWWTDEISSEYEYFSNNPEQPAKMLANLHQDMTGAKQSLGSRTQFLIYSPHSITTWLDALFESIGQYVIYSNNPFITAGRMGKYSRPHSVEIYANRGTREGFAARFVPFFNASDNMNFVEGIIGVAATAQINWDDYYIHSSDDDLWQVDQTQLKRNAFIVAAMAYWLGKATAEDTPLLLAETRAQGLRRLANDFQQAQNEINTMAEEMTAWKNARLLIEQGILREERALKSVLTFDKNSAALQKIVAENISILRKQEKEYYTQLALNYKTRFAKQASVNIELSGLEQEAAQKTPMNHQDIKTYFEKRSKVKHRGSLHSTMRFELFNFVDGQRSYFDIYKALKAENLAATRFYYGEVALEDVVKVLDEAVEVGALSLK